VGQDFGHINDKKIGGKHAELSILISSQEKEIGKLFLCHY
jgi:hypothetical protein